MKYNDKFFLFVKSLEKAGKWIVLHVIRLIFSRQQPVAHGQLQQSNIKKILLIRIEQKLGNQVMTTFFPRAIKENIPDAEVDLLIHKSQEPVWKNNPFVHRYVLFSHKTFLLNLIRLIKLLVTIRWNRYDVVIDLSNPTSCSLSNCLLMLVTGAPYRVGFSRGESSYFMNVMAVPDLRKHYIDIMHDLLALLISGTGRFHPEMFITNEETTSTRKELEALDVKPDTRLVLIWVGAKYNKQWNVEYFRSLAQLLRAEPDTHVLYICGPQEREFYNDLLRLEPSKVLYYDDIRALAALIHECSIFISGDAGPLHIAAALEKRTVGIFLQNNFLQYGYDDGERHTVVDLSHEHDNVHKVYSACRAILSAEPDAKNKTPA